VPKYQPLLQKIKKIHTLTLDFQQYIDDLRQRMVEESGGAYTLEEATTMGHPELEGKPKGKKDKDAPERIFITGDYTVMKKEPQGKVLAEKIKQLKTDYSALIDELLGSKEDLEKLRFGIKLRGEEGYEPKLHEGKSWSKFTFGHMPVAAIYPMLRKFQNDARDSETIFLGFLMNQIDEVYLSAEERSYYALMNQLNTRVMSSPVLIDTESFERKNPQYKRIAVQINKVKAVTRAFDAYVAELREQMIEESGGIYTAKEAKLADNPRLEGKPKDGNNKEIPHRIFITGDDENESEGNVLITKIKQLKVDYIRLIGELWDDGGVEGTVFALQDKKEEILELLAVEIRLIHDEYDPAKHEGKTWEEYAFENRSVAASDFILYGIQRSVNQSEMTVMNYLISPLKNYK
ncbi:MAG: hypothetical protein JKY03_03800, partial [Aureispira sp.]|nr:hypothetical protein [Aureispira sp.]